ncbi:MAG: outer membrane beta-barrel protein [bacterium]|nr:outer membrane beta-barrel protein [bacterium]
MIRNRLAILALGITAVAFLVPSFAYAQNDFYPHYNRYLSHGSMLSPRTAAMGGAYSALRGGEMGLVGNPASIAFSEERYAALLGDYIEVSSDISMVDPGLGTTLASKTEADLWGIGAGVTWPFVWGGLGLMYDYRSDDYDSDVFPASIGRLIQSGDVERHNIGLTGGYKFDDQLAVGYRYNYIDSNNDTAVDYIGPGPAANLVSIGEDFTGHKNHLGAQYMANEMFTFGLDGYYGIGDLDSNVTGDSDADSYAIRAGAAWTYDQTIPLLVALDINYESREIDGRMANVDDDLWGIHLGAEYEMVDNFFLRAGYQMEDFDYEDHIAAINESPTVSTWSLGLGYQYEQFSIDYGFMYSDTGDADMMHVIGIGFRF